MTDQNAEEYVFASLESKDWDEAATPTPIAEMAKIPRKSAERVAREAFDVAMEIVAYEHADVRRLAFAVANLASILVDLTAGKESTS